MEFKIPVAMEKIKSEETWISEIMETEIKTEIEEQFYAVIENINSEETNTVDIKPVRLPENCKGQRCDESSEFPEVITQLTKDIHSPLRCRLCAISDNQMADIFGFDATGKNILEKINYCLPVVVEETDTLPKQICRFCLEELERCYRFHKTVAEAEKQLLAFDKLTSIDLEETEGNCETLPLCDGQHGPTENNNIDGLLKTISEVEINNDKSVTIPEEAQTADTTVKSHVLSSSMRPCSVVLSITEIRCKNNLDAESRRKNFCDSKRQNTDSTTEAFGFGTTTPSDIDRRSTCDSEVPKAARSRPAAKVMKIESLQSEKGLEHVKQENLAIHEQADTRDKLYRCNSCSRLFQTQGGLNQHNKFHTGKGLHSCEFCGKRFTSSGDRNRHHIIHTGKRPFKCSVCQKRFNHRSNLKRHVAIHWNRIDYRCSVCDKYFKTLSEINRHVLVHAETTVKM